VFLQSRMAKQNLLPRNVVQGRRHPLNFRFPLRLARAREAADMSCSALSLAVDMHRGAASGLEGGGRVPRVDTVEKLAAVLHVSPCFLAYGIEQACELNSGSLSASLPSRLAQLRQERGLSHRELGRLSGTSHTFVRDTEAGSSVPNIAKVEALANALKVTACWLAYGVGDRDLPLRRRPHAQPADPAG
jgi:transcriptional regulator with XRE-family HTH domain